MRSRATQRPAGSVKNPVRSVRVADPLWQKALRRAAYEGTTMSAVQHAFIEGYANGMINPPRVQVVYDAPEPIQASEETTSA